MTAAPDVDSRTQRLSRIVPRVAVIVPVRNEESQLNATLHALATQTQTPARVVVVINNSSDNSYAIARQAADHHRHRVQIDVLEMTANTGKKAGALNRGLAHLRSQAPSRTLAEHFNYLVTMDADTELAEDFLARAALILGERQELGGVSAACRGKSGIGDTWWRRLLALFQRIEYGRYSTTRVRTNVHTMSGAGSVYRAEALDLQRLRDGYWFDAGSMVEDYALTLDLKTAGWRVTTNEHLVAYTDLMPTLRLLLAQRNRWTLGTIVEMRRRGWNRHTAPSITMMILGILGIAYTMVWSTVSARSFARYGAHIETPYLAWMGFWAFYQVQSVRHMGWKIVLFEAALLPELLFGLLRSYWLVRCIVTSYMRSVSTFARKLVRVQARTVEEVWV